MRVDGSAIDWRANGTDPIKGVRLEAADNPGHYWYVPAHMIAAADADRTADRRQRSGGGEPFSRPAPASATIAAGASPSAPATPTAPGVVLPPAPGAHARNTDPAAAHQAAARANANVSFDTWLVLAAHIAAGEHGMTGDDFPKRTGRPYQSLGPRRPWLVNAGWVELTDAKRKAKGVYRATDAGCAAWAGVAHDVRTAVNATLPAVAA